MERFICYILGEIDECLQNSKVISVKENSNGKVLEYELRKRGFLLFNKLKVRLFNNGVINIEFNDINNIYDLNIKILAMKMSLSLGEDSNGNSLEFEKNEFISLNNYFRWYFDNNNKIIDDGESVEISYGISFIIKKTKQKLSFINFQKFGNVPPLIGE